MFARLVAANRVDEGHQLVDLVGLGHPITRRRGFRLGLGFGAGLLGPHVAGAPFHARLAGARLLPGRLLAHGLAVAAGTGLLLLSGLLRALACCCCWAALGVAMMARARAMGPAISVLLESRRGFEIDNNMASLLLFGRCPVRALSEGGNPFHLIVRFQLACRRCGLCSLGGWRALDRVNA